MKSINIYDCERNKIIEFSEFRHSAEGELSLIYFKGRIRFDFFLAYTELEAEFSDFQDLLLSLERLYANERKYVTFNPLSGKIVMTFEGEYFGRIAVKCEISNAMRTGNLHILFHIDQSFLPELIMEIKSLLELTGDGY